MTYLLNMFPNKYIDLLKTTIPKMMGIEAVDIYDKNDTYSVVKIETSDPTYIWLLGMWMGNDEMSSAVRSAIPAVEKNVENLIKKVTTQSEN